METKWRKRIDGIIEKRCSKRKKVLTNIEIQEISNYDETNTE